MCFSLSAMKSQFSSLLFSVDGVFGRCQELAGADLYTYDISSSAVQRLRILLQKLAHRGTDCPFACLSLSRVSLIFCSAACVSHVQELQQLLVNCHCVRQAKEAKLSHWLAQHHRARTGHLTHIGPLFCHHRLTPAANLTGLYTGRTFRANFEDD